MMCVAQSSLKEEEEVRRTIRSRLNLTHRLLRLSAIVSQDEISLKYKEEKRCDSQTEFQKARRHKKLNFRDDKISRMAF